MMRRVLGVIVAGLMIAGCNSGGGNNPTGPSGVTSITVTSSSSYMPRGSTETFSATAMMSGGSQAVSTGVWGSDNTSVIAITPAGVATAMSPGLATIFVDFSGVRGTKLLRVLPNFGGQYIGTHMITSCTETEGWVGLWCDEVTPEPGMDLEFGLLFSQTGASLTGQTILGLLIFPQFSATVRDDGGVTINTGGTLQDPDLGPITATLRWELRADQPDRITGTSHLSLTTSSFGGEATMDTVILDSMPFGGAAAAGAHPGPTAGSLADLLRGRQR